MRKLLDQWPGITAGVLIGLIVGVGTNVLNKWIGEPQWISRLERSLTLSTDEFLALHPRWRQIVSDIIVAPEKHPEAVVRLVDRLTKHDLHLLETLSPYVISNWIVRDDTLPTRHPVPGLKVRDFIDLEQLGILTNAEHGIRVNVGQRTKFRDRDGVVQHWLYAGDLVISVKNQDPRKDFSLTVTLLTEVGQYLVDLRKARADTKYVDFVSRQIKKQDFQVSVWALTNVWTPAGQPRELWGPIQEY